jgi:hypothetical protein
MSEPNLAGCRETVKILQTCNEVVTPFDPRIEQSPHDRVDEATTNDDLCRRSFGIKPNGVTEKSAVGEAVFLPGSRYQYPRRQLGLYRHRYPLFLFFVNLRIGLAKSAFCVGECRLVTTADSWVSDHHEFVRK